MVIMASNHGNFMPFLKNIMKLPWFDTILISFDTILFYKGYIKRTVRTARSRSVSRRTKSRGGPEGAKVNRTATWKAPESKVIYSMPCFLEVIKRAKLRRFLLYMYSEINTVKYTFSNRSLYLGRPGGSIVVRNGVPNTLAKLTTWHGTQWSGMWWSGTVRFRKRVNTSSVVCLVAYISTCTMSAIY